MQRVAGKCLVLVFLGLFFLQSCKKDDPEPPVEIAFTADEFRVVESNQIVLTVKLERPAASAGKVTVQLGGTAAYTEDYNTDPSGISGSFEVNFDAGATGGQFTVATVNNEIFKGDLEITFTLSNPQGDFVLGARKTTTLIIEDNESPALANFQTATASVAENAAAGITVQIPFSQAAKGPGTLTVSWASVNASYEAHFTTLPPAAGNNMVVQVADAATSASITIVPKDDSYFHENYIIVFEITATTGSVRAGASNKLTVTIQEDENPSYASFSITDGSLAEQSTTGITVPIALSIPASEVGSMTISFTSTNATYGTHFTTEPAASGNNIVINVAKNATAAQLKINAIDNTVDNPNRVIFFTIASGTGVVRPGGAITFVLTIIDNEPTLMRVLLSFGGATAPLVTGTDTWNHAYTNTPDAGYTLADLKRADGVVMPYDLYVNTPLSPQPLGKTTGINSGVFPDNALKEYWYVPGPSEGISRSFSLLQLHNDRVYTVRMHGGTTYVAPIGRNTMTVSVNGVQKSIINTTDNVTQVLEWTGVSPVASIFTIVLTDGDGICPINALELSWYED
ncbi:MAG: hypothetical protein KF775_01685 [Cyclobacteriaceae bacterium]|nr:hypothetical protein [Cyclobacteriaceae bacterium]